MATTSSASKVGELCTVIRFSAISVDTMEWMRVSNGRSASLTAMGGRIAAGTRWRSGEADRPACPFERLPTTLVTIIAVGLYACGLDSAGQYWEGWPSDWGRSMGLRIFRSIAGPQTRAVFASTHEAFQSERCRCRSRYSGRDVAMADLVRLVQSHQALSPATHELCLCSEPCTCSGCQILV
jgi:hypothetical protein